MTANHESPDLTSFDIILINTSAGKDSQAMMDYVVELATQAGVLDRVVALHCDLGRVEWPGTAELAAEHAAHYGLPFEIQARPQGDLLDHIEARGMFPGPTTRYCTSDHKRGQSFVVMTRLVKALGLSRPARILNCIGLRAEESPARARQPVMKYNKKPSGEGTVKQVWDWHPILAWKVEDVWERIAQAGTNAHPAYAAGMPRLSCCFCILGSRSSLIRAAQLMPELAAEYAAVEVRIGHQFQGEPGKPGSLSMQEVIELAKTEVVTEVEDWAA